MVKLSASTSEMQDYKNIDVTAMIQEMINKPSENYGFMIRLVNENHYRRILFGSSDNANVKKRPKLVVDF